MRNSINFYKYRINRMIRISNYYYSNRNKIYYNRKTDRIKYHLYKGDIYFDWFDNETNEWESEMLYLANIFSNIRDLLICNKFDIKDIPMYYKTSNDISSYKY